MTLDSSHLMSTVSLFGSAASAAATAYFWISRFRREQPNLRIYPAAQTPDVILGVYRGETRSLQFKTSAVVANYSSMPNAVISVELGMKRRDGSWADIAIVRAAGLPLNVPPMTTARLELEWSVMLPSLAPAEALRANEITNAYLEHYYATPAKFGVSIWALGETEFRAVLPLAGERSAVTPARLHVAA